MGLIAQQHLDNHSLHDFSTKADLDLPLIVAAIQAVHRANLPEETAQTPDD